MVKLRQIINKNIPTVQSPKLIGGKLIYKQCNESAAYVLMQVKETLRYAQMWLKEANRKAKLLVNDLLETCCASKTTNNALRDL